MTSPRKKVRPCLSIRDVIRAGFGGVTLASFSEEFSGTNFALQVGGGVNLLVTYKVGVRVGMDYLRIFEEGGGGNVFRFGAGIVVPFSMR